MKKKDRIRQLESVLRRVNSLIGPMKIDTIRLTGKETARLESARMILQKELRLDMNGKSL